MYGENTKTIAIPLYRVLPYPVIYVVVERKKYILTAYKCFWVASVYMYM